MRLRRTAAPLLRSVSGGKSGVPPARHLPYRRRSLPSGVSPLDRAMLRAAYHDARRELLVDGGREDYARLCDSTRRVLASGVEVVLPVQSTGQTAVSHFVVRRGAPPNRVSFEHGRVIFSVAPALQRAFLSFIEFPADGELPHSPIRYHQHYDGLADDGTHVAPDSLAVVFGLERV